MKKQLELNISNSNHPELNFHALVAMMAYPKSLEDRSKYLKSVSMDIEENKVNYYTEIYEEKISKNIKNCILSGNVLFCMKLIHDFGEETSINKALIALTDINNNFGGWRNIYHKPLTAPQSLDYIRNKFWANYKGVAHFGAAYVALGQQDSGQLLKAAFSPRGMEGFLSLAEVYRNFLDSYIFNNQKYIDSLDLCRIPSSYTFDKSKLRVIQKISALNFIPKNIEDFGDYMNKIKIQAKFNDIKRKK